MKAETKANIIILLIVAIGVLLGEILIKPSTAQDAPVHSQKFKVTFSITFNELTLQGAADIEKRIKEQNRDACVVKIDEIEKVGFRIVGLDNSGKGADIWEVIEDGVYRYEVLNGDTVKEEWLPQFPKFQRQGLGVK